MRNKIEAIEQIEERIKAYQEVLERIKALPDLPDYVDIWAFSDGVNFTIPQNPKLIREVRRILGREWRLWHSHMNPENGTRIMSYKKKGSEESITVYCDIGRQGATCERVLTGYAETPQYKIVCK